MLFRASPNQSRVFPASAGMDRRRVDQSRNVDRVPRKRGDGPLNNASGNLPTLCSPQARGWTAILKYLTQVGAVFPASAGMDRDRPAYRLGDSNVPRKRGDGPTRSATRWTAGLCSPQARGWTVSVLLNGGRDIVFPASAGMDRSRFEVSLTSFPCSPQARGWTGVMSG